MNHSQQNKPAAGFGTSTNTPMAQHDESRVAESIEHGRRMVAHQISDRPLSTLALSFVAGAGIGSLVGSLLFDQYAHRHQTPTGFFNQISDTVSHAVAQAIPTSLKR